MSTPDVLIVGGGPAGMAAAVAAASQGLACCLVDEGEGVGGQIDRPRLRPPAAGPADSPRADLHREFRALEDRIDLRCSSVAWGVFDGRNVAITQNERTELIRPRTLVLASGAYEFVAPFPGWTLPGVMTPGSAQILAKTMGIAPGRRVLVAGSGPFLLAAACALVERGVEVAAVLEASPRRAWLALPVRGWRTPALLGEGLAYLTRLRRAGVPVRYGRMVVSAGGGGALETVTHAPVDAEWFPDRDRNEVEAVDTLCVGHGFVPRAFLAQLAGCALQHRPELGGWIPRRDADLCTTVPGVLAVGDGAGIAGALTATLEGRLAGLVAARNLGALTAPRFAELRRPIDAQQRRIAPIRAALDAICRPRPGLRSLVEEDTCVCRCEELSWGEVRESIRRGGSGFSSLKVMTRAGMGPCQGRYCWPALSGRVADELGVSVEQVGPSHPRPPIRPVSLGALACDPDPSP